MFNTDLNNALSRANSDEIGLFGQPDYTRWTTLAKNTPSSFDGWWYISVGANYFVLTAVLPNGTQVQMNTIHNGGVGNTAIMFFPKGTYFTSTYNHQMNVFPLKGA